METITKRDAILEDWGVTKQVTEGELPDAAFAVVLPGGEKDDEGKTVPRSLRKLPHHNENVKDPNENATVDKGRLRNALARFEQTDMPESAKAEARAHLERHAKELLPSSEAAQEGKLGPPKAAEKSTSEMAWAAVSKLMM